MNYPTNGTAARPAAVQENPAANNIAAAPPAVKRKGGISPRRNPRLGGKLRPTSAGLSSRQGGACVAVGKEEMKEHPIAAIFPPMPAAELRRLADDIKTNGLREFTPFGLDRTSLCNFDEKKKDVSAVKNGNGQQVEDAQIDAEQGHEEKKGNNPLLGLLPRKLCNKNRSA